MFHELERSSDFVYCLIIFVPYALSNFALTIIKNCLYIALVLYKICRHTALFVFGASLEYPKRLWFLGHSFPIVYRALEDSHVVLTWYKDDTQK